MKSLRHPKPESRSPTGGRGKLELAWSPCCPGARPRGCNSLSLATQIGTRTLYQLPCPAASICKWGFVTSQPSFHPPGNQGPKRAVSSSTVPHGGERAGEM